jgi:DNA-binding transcriptional LysR family regulator
VIASDAVTVLPSWTAAPHLASGRVAGIQIGREAHGRTWYAATRRGRQPEHIRVLVDVLRDALGRGDHIATAKIATAS